MKSSLPHSLSACLPLGSFPAWLPNQLYFLT